MIFRSTGEDACLLLARRLVEAGVRFVTVGYGGWDHHSRIADAMGRQLPPLDQASAALVEDLDQRGLLDQTLVCWLTEFGRTPKINGGRGRDHFPNCYSVAFAGGGIRGGQVYGSSDSTGYAPEESPCGPADLHATIFHALGIDPRTIIHDQSGRPLAICDGEPLRLG